MSAAETTVAPSSPQAAPARFRPKWYQFSLKSLTIFMIVCSVLFGGFTWRLQRAKKQAKAVATIRAQGGAVSYDFALEKDEHGLFDVKKGVAASPIPSLLRKLLGEDFFHEVYGVHHAGNPPATQQELDTAWNAIGTFPHLKSLQIAGRGAVKGGTSHSPGIQNLAKTPELQQLLIDYGKTEAQDLKVIGGLSHLQELKGWGVDFDDAALESMANLQQLRVLEIRAPKASKRGAVAISKLQNLEELQLHSCSFGDAEAIPLASLSKLKRLTLANSQIGDRGLESIAKLQALEWIDLPDAPVRDQGMDSLCQLPKLYYVNLIRTGITNVGLRKLGKAKSIRHLAVDQTQIDDDGLGALEDFRSLTDFDICWNPITDRGMAQARLPSSLKRLGMRETKITDRGLKSLEKLASLQVLDVQGSEVTSVGAAELMKSLPACRVMFAPPTKKLK